MNTTQSQSESNIEVGPAGGSSQGGPADGSSQGGPADGAGQGGKAGTADGGSTWQTRSGLPDLRQLRRPVGDRMIAGVAAGIARYLDVDVNLVRIAFVVLAFVGGAALPLYVAGWLLIPEDGADQSIAGELFSSLENRAR
jgi:phage shock protein PspC (stress-responsive transcriptional regulator)